MIRVTAADSWCALSARSCTVCNVVSDRARERSSLIARRNRFDYQGNRARSSMMEKKNEREKGEKKHTYTLRRERKAITRSLHVACWLVSYHRSNGTKRDCWRYRDTRDRPVYERAIQRDNPRRPARVPSPIVNALMELLNANARGSRAVPVP